jgi:hypothetical protein
MEMPPMETAVTPLASATHTPTGNGRDSPAPGAVGTLVFGIRNAPSQSWPLLVGGAAPSSHGAMTIASPPVAVEPPSYRETVLRDRQGPPPPYPQGDEQGAAPGGRARQIPGHSAILPLSTMLSGDERNHATKHMSRLIGPLYKLAEMQPRMLGEGYDVSSGSLCLHTLADHFVALRNAWARGELAGSAGLVRLIPSAANIRRTELEGHIEGEIERLCRHVSSSAPFSERERRLLEDLVDLRHMSL